MVPRDTTSSSIQSDANRIIAMAMIAIASCGNAALAPADGLGLEQTSSVSDAKES